MTFFKVLAWFIGIICIAAGFSDISTYGWNMVFPILIGILFLPPIARIFHIKFLWRSLSIVVLFILFAISLSNVKPSKPESSHSPKPAQNSASGSSVSSNITAKTAIIDSNSHKKQSVNTTDSFSEKVVQNELPGGKEKFTVDSDGKKHGLLVFYGKDGIKQFAENYVHGVLEGESSFYYQNGNKDWVTNYKHGKKEGLSSHWYENGKKLSEVLYKDGVKNGIEVCWYENGNKKEEKPYVNDTLNGTVKEWCENGNIKFIRPYVHGFEHGISIRYDCTTGKPDWKRKFNMGKSAGSGW